MAELLQRIISDLGRDIAFIGDDIGERYFVDWSRENPCRPEVIFKPCSSSDVSTILKHCHAAGQAVVTQGGMT
ncbi:MAG: FAD-binding oxidoreductase, partial [Gammaproteobacteria bacterium]|nr:FAD-binding oxidoreductase [Gammaproteobacteria bacterium]